MSADHEPPWVASEAFEVLHVYPVGDDIAHDTNDSCGDCICGPRTKTVHELDGTPTGMLLVHNSLDGREQREPS